MRIMRGTQDVKGNKLFKQPAGGTGRLRCMKCQNLATPHILPNGQRVMRCNGCGATYNVTAMDKQAKTTPIRVGVPRPKPLPR